MDARAVIDALISREGVSRYRLAKWLDVNESLLSRAYNGISDPGFNEVASWLDKLGYRLEIAEKSALADRSAYNIDRFGWMLDAMDKKAPDYLKVHRALKVLLESRPDSEAIEKISFSPASIKDANWRAFYAATVAYLAKMAKTDTPPMADEAYNSAPVPWSPIKRVRKSQTQYHHIYANYNVLIPEGELQWI
jgi:hypothetical protein